MGPTKTNFFRRYAIVTFSLLFFATGLSAQDATSNEVVYQEWQLLGESPKIIDVSARVVACDDVKQILLNVFNENTIDQDINFTITVKNTDGNQITKTINLSIANMQMHVAKCGDNTFDNIKINIPDGYDASKVKLSIVFN